MTGFYLDTDGTYKDLDDNGELTVLELDHSVYGLIKYVFHNDTNVIIEHSYVEDIPDDWEDEL